MITEDVVGFLREVPPFQFLEDELLAEIARTASMEYYPRDTVILKQDGRPSEYLRIIKKGGVRISVRSENGEDIILDYRGEGDNFGIWSIVEKTRQKTTVVAVDDTLCYLIPEDSVRRLLDTSAVFTEYFLKSHLEKYVDRTYGEMLSKSAFYGGTDRILFTTRVGDIAIKEVVSVREGSSIREAAQVMVKKIGRASCRERV